ncbi:hypothetical protein [Pseudomonas anguilliseptica]|uniref:hypothetical protein n=1 Tax=Pseudomonas anguilliseptica TaxID=53406 RepID=UPI00111493FD|nr:hypothetical protein [Pseudomonas anguilliseptica]
MFLVKIRYAHGFFTYGLAVLSTLCIGVFTNAVRQSAYSTLIGGGSALFAAVLVQKWRAVLSVAKQILEQGKGCI